jgi:hypothetical protein
MYLCDKALKNENGPVFFWSANKNQDSFYDILLASTSVAEIEKFKYGIITKLWDTTTSQMD